jgi:hypothetical protein
VGRRHLIRLVALVAALCVCVPVAAAGTRVSWIIQGRTEPDGSQRAHAYFALQASDLGAWVRRMTPTHEARVRHVDFSKTVLVAGFLDGNACVFDLKLKGYSFNSGRLIVDVTFRQPPVGGATCAKTSTSYVVVAFSRAQLGRLPTFVELRAFAHS